MEKEWKRELWYGPDGMYQGEIRRDEQGNIAEARNIVKTERPKVASPTISVYAAMFFPYRKEGENSGKLILHKRPANVSFAGEWELFGGGISAEANSHAEDERIIGKELNRIISEKTSFAWEIEVEHMPPMHSAVIKGGTDWAFVVPVRTNQIGYAVFGMNNIMLVSPQELLGLARGPEGNRLLSGYGKRMHRLSLAAFFYSPARNYRSDANRMLKKIHATW